MSSNVNTDGEVTQLDGRRPPDEVVTTETVGDQKELSQLLTRMQRRIADLERTFRPRRVDFEDFPCEGTDIDPVKLRLPHRFDGPVRWWVTRVKSAGIVQTTLIEEQPSSDQNTLELLVFFEATLSIRVEEAGANAR